MAEPEDVDKGRIVARRVLKPKYVVPEPGGKMRVLSAAFLEARPSNLSLDDLWQANAGENTKHDVLVSTVESARVEGHSVHGWAAFGVKAILQKQKSAVERIVKTPKLANSRHADLIAKPFLRITPEDEAESAADKADVLAKLLAEFHYEHGTFFAVPEPTVTSPASLDKS
jgi:hypothetical protein